MPSTHVITTVDHLVTRPTGTEFRFAAGVVASVHIRTQPETGYGTYPRPPR